MAVSAVLRERRKEVLSHLRREEILDAAVQLFGRKGFEATRAEEIAERAGLGKGTLYLYFKSKEAIYLAASTRALKQLQEEIARRSDGVGSFEERLATAVRVRLEFWPAHEAIYRLLLTTGREPKLRRQTLALVREAHCSFVEIFAAGVTAGEIAPGDFAQAAWTAMDLVRGATERRMDKQGTTTVQQDADWILGCVWAQVKVRSFEPHL